MRALTGVNAVLALVLEIALLAAFAAVGLLLPAPTGVRVAAAILLPVAVVAAWAVLLAPRSGRRLGARGRLLLQAGLSALAVVALATLGAVGWAAALALLAAVRLLLGARTGRV